MENGLIPVQNETDTGFPVSGESRHLVSALYQGAPLAGFSLLVKTIKLGRKQDKETIVSDCDFEWLSQWKWTTFDGYAMRRVGNSRKSGSKVVWMHREITECPQGLKVDHADRNRLNNQRHNLRVCTHAENCANTPKRQSVDGFRGIQLVKGRYQARIGFERKVRYLGSFATAIEAATCYDDAAKELHGEFAILNFPQQTNTERD